MSQVTSYTSLDTAVQAYLKRSNISSAAGNLDYLIQEVEQEVNSRLRVRHMLTAITPTVSSAGVVTLPTGFGGWKRFQARQSGIEWDLDLKSAEQVSEITQTYTPPSGRPEAVITNGSTSQIVPYTDATYTFAALHYTRVPNLTSSATTNWLITNFPMVYLYGCLAAARGLVSDDTPVGASRFELWAKRFDMAIKGVQREDAIDLDARSHATLDPDTSLFSRGPRSNITADQ